MTFVWGFIIILNQTVAVQLIRMQETAEAASLALLVEGEDSKHFNMQRIAKLQQKSARGLKRLAKKGVSVEVGS